MTQYRIKRLWLVPWLLEVWTHDDDESPDFRGRTYWWRIGTFGRRKTAEAFIEWHKARFSR